VAGEEFEFNSRESSKQIAWSPLEPKRTGWEFLSIIHQHR